MVHSDLHKTAQNGGFGKFHQKWIASKTEVFENALNQCEGTKTEAFENAPVGNNELHKLEQCERTKRDILGAVFVIRWIFVNDEK